MQRFWHISSSGSGAQYPDEGAWWVASLMSTRRRNVRKRSEVQGLYIYCNMGQPKRRGNTLLPLQGVKSPVILGYPGCRFACPGLSARWAFSPLCLITPRTWFCTSNWTPWKIRQFANSWKYLWTFLVIHGNSWPHPRPLADKYNPQMLNRFETDENPYNICLTSADK